MAALSRPVAVHAAPAGDGAAAPAFGTGLGRIALGLGLAAVDLATGGAVDIGGTPGADKTAAGRVSDMAFGAADLPNTVSEVALVVVALVAESAVAATAFAEPPAADGEAACCVADVTAAVMGYAGAASAHSIITSNLRFMDGSFIAVAARMRGPRHQVPRFRL
jgi:hypothetical protein